jgi:hypothetical protein
MGFITGLLTFPLAPVRGTVWIAERIAEQAERERDDQTHIRRELAELEMRYDLGELSEEEFVAAEEEILERLTEATTVPGEEEVPRATPHENAEEA